jgi:hypothetical protein
VVGGKEPGTALEKLAALPLKQRYTWRVASALKWAFSDLETLNVEADCQTMSPDDQSRLAELLKNRPLQFCLFMSALFGQDRMEQLMVSAIRSAKVVAAHSERLG